MKLFGSLLQGIFKSLRILSIDDKKGRPRGLRLLMSSPTWNTFRRLSAPLSFLIQKRKVSLPNLTFTFRHTFIYLNTGNMFWRVIFRLQLFPEHEENPQRRENM